MLYQYPSSSSVTCLFAKCSLSKIKSTTLVWHFSTQRLRACKLCHKLYVLSLKISFISAFQPNFNISESKHFWLTLHASSRSIRKLHLGFYVRWRFSSSLMKINLGGCQKILIQSIQSYKAAFVTNTPTEDYLQFAAEVKWRNKFTFEINGWHNCLLVICLWIEACQEYAWILWMLSACE